MKRIPYSKTKYARRNYNPERVAKWLVAKGYKQVSGKFCIIARVDISDEKLRAFFIKDNLGNANSGVPCMYLEDQKDHYRRCNSADIIYSVPKEIMAAIRNKGAVAH